ncbi:amidohydrolase [Apiospora aurea]|uniref:Amidohydrolase n=1 Tax=Apiospora aurea TaxID=335848 RepID=A0ABR1Q5M8_9PEZI
MLPPYSATGPVPPAPPPRWRRRRPARLTRALKFVGLACLGFIVYAQWRQISSSPANESAGGRRNPSLLSADKLQADLQTCAKLHKKPQDPVGLGRERNARYVDGHKPTLIKNATVWVGEPAKGTSAEDAWAGKGYAWINADVYLEYGLIKKVEKDISLKSLASDTLVWDAKGRQLTTGIIDMHSHAGVDSLPELEGNDDTNEMSADITPYVRSIDGLQPQDHQIQVIKSGGVTTSLVLPGSGNNIGGEAYPIKHAVGQPDGREEISVADMLADPDRNWRYMKMACGENAKRVYGQVGEHGPVSRLGESWEFRRAFETAATLNQAQDDWCARAEAPGGLESVDGYLPRDLKWESLGAALRGQVHINAHCYTIPDLEAFVDHTNEFNFSIRAFHHAHQTYLVPEILKRAWGPTPPASALFADNMWYKAEAYIGSEYAGKTLWENGLTPIYVSDNPVLNAQHVVFEAAKAFGYGLPYAVALASVTTAPAERLGMGERLGKIKPGYDADVVVWDSDPLTVGAAPVQVWIDGTAQFDDPVELEKPVKGPIDPKTTFDMPAGEPTEVADVVFTGVTASYLPGLETAEGSSSDNNLTVAISNGKITCVGACPAELAAATQRVHLKNGHLTKPFTAFGSTLGLNAIDAEDSTDNGHSTSQFSRAADGLRLGTKKLRYAHRYGVTRAISAPGFTGAGTHFGVSAGFRTWGYDTVLEGGAVFKEEVAVHYTLQEAAAKAGGSGTVSGAVGALRRKLLKAVGDDEAAGEGSNETAADAFAEEAYLGRVVRGEVPLAITAHSADGIAGALKLKKQVEEASGQAGLTMVIIGGAESHLVADELAEAHVGVVLAPLQSYRTSWDQRRALTGAPLTNGTAVDALVKAGVTVAIGLEEDWVVRDLGLLAGIVYRNGEGRVSEGEALELVGGNVYKMLGLSDKDKKEKEAKGQGQAVEDFLVFEGSPLEIGGEDSGGRGEGEGGFVCISRYV